MIKNVNSMSESSSRKCEDYCGATERGMVGVV